MARMVLTPISSRAAIAQVERETGERPGRAEWQLGHWAAGYTDIPSRWGLIGEPPMGGGAWRRLPRVVR